MAKKLKGRPKKKTEKFEVYSLRLKPSTAEALKVKAGNEGLFVTAYIRNMLEGWARKQ